MSGTSSSSPDSTQWLVSWVPSENPNRWLWINALSLVYSVILMLVLCFAGERPREIMLAKHSYLIYDGCLSSVWVLQIGLTVWHSYFFGKKQRAHDDTSSSCSVSPWHILELLIAIYFCASSIHFLDRDWDDDKVDGGMTDMFIDMVINVVAYFYITIEVFQNLKKHQQQEGSNVEGYMLTRELSSAEESESQQQQQVMAMYGSVGRGNVGGELV